MELNIEHNPFRLLNKKFLLLVPVKMGQLSTGGKYGIRTSEYGKMGIAECIEIRQVQLMMVTDMMIHASEAIENYKDLMNKNYVFNSDIIQCCVFHFMRRYDEAFEKMIQKESVKIGLKLSHDQLQLFS